MASFTEAETAAAIVLVSAWRFYWTMSGAGVDWLSCCTIATGSASCRSEAGGNGRRRLERLPGPAVRFLGGMIQREEINYTTADVR